jgi:hypothetical protein
MVECGLQYAGVRRIPQLAFRGGAENRLSRGSRTRGCLGCDRRRQAPLESQLQGRVELRAAIGFLQPCGGDSDGCASAFNSVDSASHVNQTKGETGSQLQCCGDAILGTAQMQIHQHDLRRMGSGDFQRLCARGRSSRHNEAPQDECALKLERDNALIIHDQHDALPMVTSSDHPLIIAWREAVL